MYVTPRVCVDFITLALPDEDTNSMKTPTDIVKRAMLGNMTAQWRHLVAKLVIIVSGAVFFTILFSRPSSQGAGPSDPITETTWGDQVKMCFFNISLTGTKKQKSHITQ